MIIDAAAAISVDATVQRGRPAAGRRESPLYFECLPQATVILYLRVDGQIGIEHTNAAARELLLTPNCLQISCSRLAGFAGAASESLADAVQRARRGEDVRVVINRPRADGVHQLWHVTLARLTEIPASASASATRIIATVRAPARAEPGIAALSRLYGLTTAEARVLALLSTAATPSEIARVLGVAVSTVRSQLQALFQKTGVRRQPELIKLALLAA